VLSALYHFIGPIRFWLMVVSAIYGSIYARHMYKTGMRRAHEFHALGLPRSVQGCVNEEFSYRLSQREPLMLIYVATFFIFLGASVTLFIEP
jgi:hypothetical protein